MIATVTESEVRGLETDASQTHKNGRGLAVWTQHSSSGQLIGLLRLEVHI